MLGRLEKSVGRYVRAVRPKPALSSRAEVVWLPARHEPAETKILRFEAGLLRDVPQN
jgi:hypothetical protein